MLKTLIRQQIYNQAADEKTKKNREIKASKDYLAKVETHKLKTDTFGWFRVLLAFLFGPWVLFWGIDKGDPDDRYCTKEELAALNARMDARIRAQEEKEKNEPPKAFEKPYVKYYTQIQVARRYEKMLRKKYKTVWLSPVFNDAQQENGYLLHGEGRCV